MRAITRSSLNSPAVVVAGVALTLLLGIFAFIRIPVELLPQIARPQIGIETDWRAQTPREVESQIIEPEEQVLRDMPRLQEMEGHANFGEGYINLTFPLGTDMNKALVDVIGRLDRIQTLPVDAQKPLAELANKQDKNAVLLSIFLQKRPGNDESLQSYIGFIRNTVVPQLQAIPGVGTIEFTGHGAADELQVSFDPMRAAQLSIQIPKIALQIGTSDDVSGGTIDVGRRKFGLSFRGRYSIETLKQTVLDWRSGNPITLADIATVKIGQARRQGFAYHNGQPALEVDVFQTPGANELSTIQAVKAAINDLNEGDAKDKNVSLEVASDPILFIRQALGLVALDIVLGIALAIGVLWFFMREWRATMIVSCAIPICVCAVVAVLYICGRTLNVISLAAIAVASGMMLDAAIVVMENILRMREAGESTEQSAHDGTHQVWRALFASTATNVAIFLPVIFLEDVEGQLLSDLALAIALSVLFAFIVAITVIPVASKLFMQTRYRVHELSAVWTQIADRAVALTDSREERRLWIIGLIGISVIGAWILFPSIHYLPDVKRDVINVSLQYPPGATLDFAEREIAGPLVRKLQPYASGRSYPKLDDWFLTVDTSGYMNVSLHMDRHRDIAPMEDILRNDVLKGLPDTVGYAEEETLFGGYEEGSNIAINIQSDDNDVMRAAARKGFNLLSTQFPDAAIRTQPALDYDEPQFELIPDDRAIAEAGWTRLDASNILQALGEGLYMGQRFDDGEQLYLILKSKTLQSQSDLENTPLVTPAGNVIYFGSLVTVERTLDSSGIYTLGGLQTYSLSFEPPQGLALSDALAKIRTSIEPQIRAALGSSGSISYGAAANDLSDALWAMAENFGFAVAILFLIMAALFRSIRDAAIAMIGLPLGAVGGVLALRLLEIFVFQPLDLLTMTGFLIVLGLAVNNTILLVARTREAEAEGLSRIAAVRSTLEIRLRPIFLSSLTALAGMLPLLLIQGPGSEMYRGLAAVLIGGVVVSQLFTIVLMPALLRTGEGSANAEQKPKDDLLEGARA